MFKSGHEYHKYCKCTGNGNTAETMCEFCKKYSKLRYYQSMWNRNQIKSLSGMDKELSILRSWYYNTTGKMFESPGRGRKSYIKSEQTIDNRSKCATKEDITQSRITPDTFEFKNNIIKIKDSRDIAVLIINLESREITSFNTKYKFESHELEMLQEKLSRIQSILEE